MLKVSELHVAYGGLAALRGVSLEVAAGEFVSIVGPNGAGKTTLFKAVSGIVPLAAGAIAFEGCDLAAVRASERAHLGIAHVPEGRQVFPSLTVMETLEMGALTGAGRRHWKQNLDSLFALFPVLAARRTQAAGTLSGGEQQMLAIARGLASSPKLLMLDEPSMGLAPTITDLIFERIAAIRAQLKLTILMVEQRVVEALQACDHGYVLETGRVALSGSRDQLLANDRVRQAYLGI
jgi:branched-chain amino acid transport system ATP-binding protein